MSASETRTASADGRRQLRIERSAGDLPKGCTLVPTTLGTFKQLGK